MTNIENDATSGADGVTEGNGGEPAFDFDANGLRVDAESSPAPSAGEPLKVAFTVCNVGGGPGAAHVTVEVDGTDSGVSWDSPVLAPGECASPDGDGYVHEVPSQSEGRHTFEAAADPAGPNGGRSGPNEVDVGAAE